MTPYTHAFLTAILWAYPEDMDIDRDAYCATDPINDSNYSPEDFSPEFIEAADEWLSAFYETLSESDLSGISMEQFGHGAYFSLSGHGCGFWDSRETEHLQPLIEAFAGGKYRFEEIDLMENARGELDLSVKDEYIDRARGELFAVRGIA